MNPEIKKEPVASIRLFTDEKHTRAERNGSSPLTPEGSDFDYRLLFKNSAEAALISTTGGKVLDANLEACRILRRRRGDIITAGRNEVFDVLDPGLQPALAQQEKTGKFKGELRLLRRGGVPFSAEVSMVAAQGEVILIAFRDITDRKNAEAALRESEGRYRSLVQNAPDLILVLEADTTVRYVNSAVESILGYRPEEWIGEKLAGYVHLSDLELAMRSFAAAGTEACSLRFCHKDSSWRCLEGFTANLLDDPNVRGLMFDGRDVTERVRGEEEVKRLKEDLEGRVASRTGQLEALVEELGFSEQTLRESEERFRLLVEGIKDYAVFMLDPEGYVLSWNSGAERLEGYRAKEIVGQHFSLFYVLEDVEGGRPDKELRTAADGGRLEAEGWRVRKDGSRFWADEVVAALKGEAGDLRGFVKIVRDFTERKRVQDELRESEELFRVTFDLAALGVAQVAPDGRWLRVNRKLCEIVGYSENELLGKTYGEITHDDDLDAELEQARRLLAGEVDTYSLEKRYIRRDRSRVWANLSVSLVRGPGAPLGEPKHFIFVVEEITGRRRKEQLLRSLTPREIEVLKLLARGYKNREIAETLAFSMGTAKVNVQRIINKLGVSDRTQAAVYAVELGMLSSE